MDEITVTHALIQLGGLNSESKSGCYCFRVKWGVRRRRTCTLEYTTDEAYVFDILLNFRLCSLNLSYATLVSVLIGAFEERDQTYF